MCSCGEGKVMAWKENVYEVGFGASMEMLGGGEGERKGIRKRLGWRRREEQQRRRRSYDDQREGLDGGGGEGQGQKRMGREHVGRGG